MSAKPSLHTWECLSDEQVYECRVFTVRCHRSRFSRDRAEHDFHVLECPDWVNIIPITPENEVVMVRQFRHGTRALTLEVPGGMVDPEDASPLIAARREMIEESGFDSNDVRPLGSIHPNPALQANYCHTFVAYDVRPCGEPSFDGTEETEVVLLPLDVIPDRIRDGSITHALVVVAFHWLALAVGDGDGRRTAK